MATTIDGPVRAHAAPKGIARTRAASAALYARVCAKHIAYGCGLSLWKQCTIVYWCLGLYVMGHLYTWPTIVLILVGGMTWAFGRILWEVELTKASIATASLRCAGIALLFGLQTYACVRLELAHYW